MTRRQRLRAVVTLAALLSLLPATGRRHTVAADASSWAVSYTGTDYYTPSDYFSGCPRWTWLTSCYTNASASQTAQQQVSSDAAFLVRHGQGTFQRVWVELDELMLWNSTTGYQGFNPQYLANLDDALARFHAQGITVDLVLFSWAPSSGDQEQFHPEALDGTHSTMRANYLQAVRDFVTHLAANPTDAATVAVMDLQNEAYYMLEQYFAQGLSYLGTYTQCWTGAAVNPDCVDQTITHPWLTDLYTAAHGAAPGFQYTVSDTTRLLKDAPTWTTMYPVDVYDIHVYDDAPWTDASFYATAKSLPKPWFAGEAGCTPGNSSCTYTGTTTCTQPTTCALSVDSWFLNNLQADGAQAVLVEDRTTAWAYPNGPNSQSLTAVGQALQSLTQASATSTPAPRVSSTPVPPTATMTVVPPSATATPTSTVGPLTATASSTAVPLAVAVSGVQVGTPTVHPGGTEPFTATLSATAPAANEMVTFRVYNAHGKLVWQAAQAGVQVLGGGAQAVRVTWVVPSKQALGTYTLGLTLASGAGVVEASDTPAALFSVA